MRNDLKLRIIMWFMIVFAVIVGVSVYIVVFTGNKDVVSRSHDDVVADIAKKLEIDKSIEENLEKDALAKTQELIDEVKDSDINLDKVEDNEDNQGLDKSSKTLDVVPGTSKINVGSGIVVNQDGTQADNTAGPGDYRAPQVSSPISIDDAPNSGMKLTMTENSISPSSFTVKQNQVISLTISSGDKWSHVFKFKDEILSGVAIGLGESETRSIVFNAPNVTGEYIFYDEVGSFEKKGAKGKMIVIK